MVLSREDLEAYLKLREYGKPITVRGFQRLAGYSSPGKAQRVLSRLERLGFIERLGTEYIAKDDLPPQLAMYIVIKRYVIPRVLIYALYSSITVAIYTILSRPPLSIVLLLASLAIPYWAEAIRSLAMLKALFKG